jgi:hypothetical protein
MIIQLCYGTDGAAKLVAALLYSCATFGGESAIEKRFHILAMKLTTEYQQSSTIASLAVPAAAQ